MLVTSRFIHVQEIPNYRIDNIHASLLHAVAVELLEEDAFFDQALTDRAVGLAGLDSILKNEGY
jgi:hypothetical protein